MTVSIQNQKPQVLKPSFAHTPKGDFDLRQVLDEILIKNVFTPLALAPVTISVDSNTYTNDDLFDDVCAITDDTVDPDAEERVKSIFAKSCVYYTKDDTDTASSVFVNQAGTKESLPRPSKICIYVAQDVIDTAKQFLGGVITFDNFFATLGYYAHPDTLAFAFTNIAAFDTFKEYFKAQATALSSFMTADVNQLVQSFDTDVNLDGLTDSLVLRKESNDSMEPFSFARVLVDTLMTYTETVQPDDCHIMPFSLGELVAPKSLVFVNLAEHVNATPRQVTDTWKTINQSLAMPRQRISTKKIRKLDAAARNMQKVKSLASVVARKQPSLAKSAHIPFSQSSPTTVDLTRRIKKVMKKMGSVMRSQNCFKTVKSSFARPSRRNPDDFNLKGKLVSTAYKPDIHLYLDTSGSISEKNYQDMVRACIKLARELNVALYVNSFSHYISDCTFLPTKGRTSKQIYKQFRKIPKVTGGTAYNQVWMYIADDKRRRRELSLIITDFEYLAPRNFSDYPQNIYYLPCAKMDWDYMIQCAQNFVNSMKHIDPNIRRHILI